MGNKSWHIIVSNSKAAAPKSFSINNFLFHTLIFFFAILTVSLIVLTTYNIKRRTELTQLEKYRNENELLRENINRIYTEIDSIVNKLNQMEDWENQIRMEKNLEIIDNEIKKMGIGGLPQINEDFLNYDRDTNLDFQTIENFINQIKVQVDFSYDSRQNLAESVIMQSEMYRYTPSIYPAYGRISTPFGWRTHPITGKRDFHNGIDISNNYGTPIYSTADGIIREVSYNRFIGNYIVINHKYGYVTKYGHLQRSLVRVGDEVVKGQIIAEMGNSGRSTGPHLHYEVTRYNRLLNPYHTLIKMEEDIIITSN